jgi:hypothetical protein
MGPKTRVPVRGIRCAVRLGNPLGRNALDLKTCNVRIPVTLRRAVAGRTRSQTPSRRPRSRCESRSRGRVASPWRAGRPIRSRSRRPPPPETRDSERMQPRSSDVAGPFLNAVTDPDRSRRSPGRLAGSALGKTQERRRARMATARGRCRELACLGRSPQRGRKPPKCCGCRRGRTIPRFRTP